MKKKNSFYQILVILLGVLSLSGGTLFNPPHFQPDTTSELASQTPGNYRHSSGLEEVSAPKGAETKVWPKFENTGGLVELPNSDSGEADEEDTTDPRKSSQFIFHPNRDELLNHKLDPARDLLDHASLQEAWQARYSDLEKAYIAGEQLRLLISYSLQLLENSGANLAGDDGAELPLIFSGKIQQRRLLRLLQKNLQYLKKISQSREEVSNYMEIAFNRTREQLDLIENSEALFPGEIKESLQLYLGEIDVQLNMAFLAHKKQLAELQFSSHLYSAKFLIDSVKNLIDTNLHLSYLNSDPTRASESYRHQLIDELSRHLNRLFLSSLSLVKSQRTSGKLMKAMSELSTAREVVGLNARQGLASSFSRLASIDQALHRLNRELIP